MTLPLLAVEHVTRRFGGVAAVNDVSLEVEPGEILGVIGPNGAGKTTLMQMISGLERPKPGRIYFKGRNVTRAPAHVRARKGIGRAFQVVRPFAGMTVLETVTVAAAFAEHRHGQRLGAPRRAARDVIERVGLGSSAEVFGSELTLSALKRLELAKALALDPDLLLLDEVMAGLNSVEVEELMTLLRAVRDSGVTLLVVEHVMKAVMGVCTRVVVLHEGVVIASGTPTEVTSHEAVIAAYLGTRFGAKRPPEPEEAGR